MTTKHIEACRITQLDNGIHEIVIVKSGRDAADAIADYIVHFMQTTPPTVRGRYLVDNSQVPAIPVAYARERLKTADKARQPERQPGRVAILYDGAIAAVANSMLRLAMQQDLRIFPSRQRDIALTWLTEDA